MPNDCWNHITITADPGDLFAFMVTELKDVPQWAIKIFRRGAEAVVFKLWSQWAPDFNWLEELLTKYPSCWIKNEWNEEGGREGVWVGSMRSGKKEIKQMEWEGMCIEEKAHRFRDAVKAAEEISGKN
ncbi:hypothetical protein EBV26_15520 [bacterium]|jgi:hypothetical protein|nr:hypothetical protein [bacterium]